MGPERTRPQATRQELEKFCTTEGWTLARDARGRAVLHHVTYKFTLPDGTNLRTRISRPPDGTPYDAGMWSFILRTQLHVTAEEFWACVRNQVKPDRGTPVPPPDAVPAKLAHLLLTDVHLTESEVFAMTREEAIDRLNKFWTEGT